MSDRMKLSLELQAKTTEAAAAVKSFVKDVVDVGKAAESAGKASTRAANDQVRAQQAAARAGTQAAGVIRNGARTQQRSLDGLVARLVQMRAEVAKVGPMWAVVERNASGALNSIKGQVFSIQGALAGLGVVGIAADFLNTASAFENLELSLETLSGSSAQAKRDMDWISEFTATTPYELQEVADGFRKLSSYGLEPTKYLRTLGDTAASMSKRLDDAVEAFADAASGEFERLKEFGIRASTEGDRVTFSWIKNGQQLQQTVVKTGTAITTALGQIWSDRYSGGMERLSKGWSGLWSNMRDQITQFERDVMEAGVLDWMKKELTDILNTLRQAAQNGSLQQTAEGIGENIVGALETLKSTLEGLKSVYDTIPDGLGLMVFGAAWGSRGGLAGAGAGAVLGGSISLIGALKQSLEGLKQSMAGEISFSDYLWADRQELETLLDQADESRKAKNTQVFQEDAQRIKALAASFKQASGENVTAENDSAAKIKSINDELASYRSVKWDEIVKTIQSKLKEAEAAEKKYSEEVERLQDERAKVGMTAQEKIRSMLRSTMTEAQAYQDEVTEANESLRKAQLAMRGGDMDLSQTWAKKAQEQFAGLNSEVRDGEKVVVTAAQAQSTAVQGYVQATRVLEESLLAQEKTAETARSKEAERIVQLKSDLDTVKQARDAITDLEFKVAAIDAASGVLGEIQADLAKIKDKTVTVTVRYNRVGSDSGGDADGYSDGGPVRLAGGGDWRRIIGQVSGPGTSTSDSIRALLSDEEFVIRAPAQRAASSVFPGFWDAANAVNTPMDFAKLIGSVSSLFAPPPVRLAGGGSVSANAISASSPVGNELLTLMIRADDKEYPVRMVRDDRDILAAAVGSLNHIALMSGA